MFHEGEKAMHINGNNLSRRTFLGNTSLIAAGSVAGAITGNGCSTIKFHKRNDAAKIDKYNPKKDGGCSVTFSYDVDMPSGGNEYLYDRIIPWLRDEDGHDAHGHLNEDIRDYIETIITIAENYDAKLQFFILYLSYYFSLFQMKYLNFYNY